MFFFSNTYLIIFKLPRKNFLNCLHVFFVVAHFGVDSDHVVTEMARNKKYVEPCFAKDEPDVNVLNSLVQNVMNWPFMRVK